MSSTANIGLIDHTAFGEGESKSSSQKEHSGLISKMLMDNLALLSTKERPLGSNIHAYFSSLSSILVGIDTMIAKEARILCSPIGFTKKSVVLKEIFTNRFKENMLLTSPSGNKGNGTVLSPGIFTDVFCVGAVDKNGKVAPFSGRMYDKDGNCLKPEVCALGVDVEVELEDGSKHVVNGTSFACAQVAGVAAALFEANPEATVNDVKMALIESCTPAEGSRFGNINPEKALELIKTKVPYQEQFQPIPDPEWFNEQYIDYRLISQCKRARKNNKDVEGLVVGEDTDALIKRLEKEMSGYISEYNSFKNFDMAHIIAKPEFYDALFEQPDLEVASAVDINYFDM